MQVKKDRILGIWTDWVDRKTFGGCGYYRCVQPLRTLGIRTTAKIWGDLYPDGLKSDKAWELVFKDTDILFSMKVDNPTAISQIIPAKNYFKKRLIVDVDDDYFTIDDYSFAKRIITPEKIKAMEVYMQEADAISVSTPHLKGVYSKYNDNIYINPNYIDLKDFNYPNKKINDGKIRIGWQGSFTHERDLAMVVPALREVMKRNKNVIFGCIGYDSPTFGVLPRKQFKFIPGVMEFMEFPPYLASQGFDITIAPLFNMKFNYAKSAIKYYEYGAFKIPTVCTGGPGCEWSPYHGKFKHGVEGFYARTHNDWVNCLNELIYNETLRRDMGEAGYRNVEKNYQINTHYCQWENMFLSEQKKLYERKPNIIKRQEMKYAYAGAH